MITNWSKTIFEYTTTIPVAVPALTLLAEAVLKPLGINYEVAGGALRAYIGELTETRIPLHDSDDKYQLLQDTTVCSIIPTKDTLVVYVRDKEPVKVGVNKQIDTLSKLSEYIFTLLKETHLRILKCPIKAEVINTLCEINHTRSNTVVYSPRSELTGTDCPTWKVVSEANKRTIMEVIFNYPDIILVQLPKGNDPIVGDGWVEYEIGVTHAPSKLELQGLVRIAEGKGLLDVCHSRSLK